MSRQQDRATADRHAKTLRELVKRPDNKVCADCKRNDPRWASWNLGVFLCIRCSGIHRGMGTHISKVKSVDLDMWTPEQMESIQKWGNYRANLYWEAHLKAGHVPPDHKMESFIRSKYESRRWAMEGPPPTDPSVLDSPAPVSSEATSSSQAPQPQVPTQTHERVQSISSSARTGRTQATTAATSTATTTRQPGPHQLLSANYLNRPTGIVPQQAQPAAAPPSASPQPAPQQTATQDLFSLDFHSPSPPQQQQQQAEQPKKDVKQDILSLFSAAPPQPQVPMSNFGNVWGQPSAQPQQTSMMGTSGAGAWGVSSSWTANNAAAAPTQANVWGTPPTTVPQAGFGGQAPANAFSQQSLFNTTSVWGAPAPTTQADDLFGSFSTSNPPATKKDDAFGDIWGGFK